MPNAGWGVKFRFKFNINVNIIVIALIIGDTNMAATNLLDRLLEATEMCGHLRERVYNAEEKYREAMWKLNEAQTHIDNLSARIKDLESAKPSAPAQVTLEVPTVASSAGWVTVKCICHTDRKIDMIRSVRVITGLGLKEAKDFVEGTPTRITLDALDEMQCALFQVSLPSVFTVIE